MRVKILGKIWTISFENADVMKDAYGFCTNITEPNKRICIYKKLKGKELLRVLIHEALHCTDWTKDEEWVDAASNDLANLLWKLGWRKDDETH